MSYFTIAQASLAGCLFTSDHGNGLLYACDASGMHCCSKDPYDTEGMKELPSHLPFATTAS